MTEPPPAGAPAVSSRDRIVEATLELIASDGLGSITMMGIAERAGVARQTLYNHYPDVDSIVVDAIGRHNRQSIRTLDAVLHVVDRPEERLEQLVRHMVAVGAHAHRGIGEVLSPAARAALREHDAALDDRVRGILEEGRRDGAFRPDLEPSVDAVLVRHLLKGLAHEAARAPQDAARLAAAGTRTIRSAFERR